MSLFSFVRELALVSALELILHQWCGVNRGNLLCSRELYSHSVFTVARVFVLRQYNVCFTSQRNIQHASLNENDSFSWCGIDILST